MNRAKDILVDMGEYFQIQDDVLDCFADPEVLGKVGTDIQDNKCSWLVVQALAHASPEQRELLVRDYGKHDDEAVERVKALYRELELYQQYERYEEDSYRRLRERIDTVAAGGRVPGAIFDSLLHKIYKRSK